MTISCVVNKTSHEEAQAKSLGKRFTFFAKIHHVCIHPSIEQLRPSREILDFEDLNNTQK